VNIAALLNLITEGQLFDNFAQEEHAIIQTQQHIYIKNSLKAFFLSVFWPLYNHIPKDRIKKFIAQTNKQKQAGIK